MTDKQKDLVQYATAVFALVAGIILVFASWYRSSSNEVPDSALMFCGQCMIYAATLFGFGIAFSRLVNSLKK